LVLADAARRGLDRRSGPLSGTDKVVVWSDPIVKNGLIYVIDIPDDLPGVTECSASGPRGCADLALIHALGVGGMEMV